jgi:hypothetical protein
MEIENMFKDFWEKLKTFSIHLLLSCSNILKLDRTKITNMEMRILFSVRNVCVAGLFLFAFSPLLSMAQTTATLMGTVKDHHTQEPLIGATIILENTAIGIATDPEGK